MSGCISRPLAAALCLALLSLFTGCRSTPPLLLDKDGQPVAGKPPATYRIAVAPLEIQAGLEARVDVKGIQETRTELERQLLQALREVQAASEVFTIDSSSSFGAYNEKADLLLLPRLEDVSFGRVGTSRAALASALWLTTWIGSLYVEDLRYDARLAISYDVVDPHSGAHLADSVQVDSEETDLSFWDRNRAFSGNFFLTLLVPPFFTQDDEAKTREALVGRATALIAAQVKRYLRETLPVREFEALTRIEVLEPENGSRVKGAAALRCDIYSQRMVTEVVVLINDDLYRKWEESELPNAREQAFRGFFHCPVHVDRLEAVKMKPGRNMIRLLVNVAGQWASRSILVHHDEPVGSAERSPS